MKLRRRCFSLHRLALIRRVSQLEVVAPPSRSPESITRDPLARLVKQTKLPGKYLASVSFLTHVFLCFVGSTHVVSIGVFSMLHKCLFLSVSSFANTCFFSCSGAPVRKFGKVWMGFSPRLSTAGKLSCCPRCWERTATVQEILEAHLSLRDGLRMVGLAARSQQQDGAGRKKS